MLQLLKVEWLKLKNYRTFWILAVLYVISNFGLTYIALRLQEQTSKDMGGMAKTLMGNPPFAFPEIWHTASFLCSFLLFIPGLLVIISLTNEFSYKTHRQNIVDGWSRQQFILVKLILVGIISLVSTLFVFLTAWIFGLQSGTAFSTEKIEFIGYFFLQALSYTSVALLFSLFIKRSGLAIGIYFLYTVVLENLVGGVVGRYIEDAGHYFPLNTTDSLIPFPFFRRVTDKMMYQPDYNILVPLAIGYLVLYFVISVRKYKRDDL
jgi:ABC-2 type transport system permease protein